MTELIYIGDRLRVQAHLASKKVQTTLHQQPFSGSHSRMIEIANLALTRIEISDNCAHNGVTFQRTRHEIVRRLQFSLFLNRLAFVIIKGHKGYRKIVSY